MLVFAESANSNGRYVEKFLAELHTRLWPATSDSADRFAMLPRITSVRNADITGPERIADLTPASGQRTKIRQPDPQPSSGHFRQVAFRERRRRYFKN